MCDILSQCVYFPSKLLSPWFPDSLSQWYVLRENQPSGKSSLSWISKQYIFFFFNLGEDNSLKSSDFDQQKPGC